MNLCEACSLLKDLLLFQNNRTNRKSYNKK
jgi:hypothetical protein